MKNILKASLLILLGCSSAPKFTDKDVCILVYNMTDRRYEYKENDKQCHVRFPTCSTFKVPLSVMAFDAKVLKDKTTKFKWDGEKRFLDVWNKDHTADSWMKESVVWYSQKLTPMIGEKRISDYLQKFSFGNGDMSGGLKSAWLTPAGPERNSLKINAHEQIAFTEKLWRGELEASQYAMTTTQEILAQDSSPKGNILKGKTGSGLVGEKQDLRLGWYVGHLQAGKKEYILVVNFVDKQNQPGKTFGGMEAKAIGIDTFKELDLW